jgi:hypothetical protein
MKRTTVMLLAAAGSIALMAAGGLQPWSAMTRRRRTVGAQLRSFICR